MDDIVGDPDSCVLAYTGDHGPALMPLACWSDGTAVWMAVPADSEPVTALRSSARCALYVPPAAADAGEPAERGVVVAGRARVYGSHDPVGLALHAAAVSAAMAALALRHAPALLASLSHPERWGSAMQQRVALKVTVDRLHGVDLPATAAGVAPALPPELPSGLRRALAGTRRGVLAAQRQPHADDAGAHADVAVAPVLVGAGFALTGLEALDMPDAAGAPAALLLTADDGRRRPLEGLLLGGHLRAGRLEPQRATWWHGGRGGTLTLSPRPAGGLVLPD